VSAAHADVAVPRRGGHFALPGTLRAAAALAAPGALVFLLGLEHGGYYATAWSTAAVGALATGTLVVVRRRAVQLALPFLLPFSAFVAWIGIEALRPTAATLAVPELERSLLYLAVVWAALQFVDERNAAVVLGGVLAAMVALVVDGLAHVLFPLHITADGFEGRLLFLPLGYANACGAVAAMAIVLSLDARRARTAAATGLVPVAVALALTQSKGAVLALAVGLVATAVLNPHRGAYAGRALVLLPLPTVAALFAARSHVADANVASAVVARDCVVVAAATCLAAGAQFVVARRVRFTAPAWTAGLAAAVVVAGTVAAATKGFADRSAYWHVAWRDALAHPLVGSGAGTFAREWLAHRTTATGALNAHSLFLETLAELGPIGLLLLLGALAAPLVVVARHRSPLAAVAAGAYATFLTHAAVDWDWQMPAVACAGLLCGICALRAAGGDGRPSRRAVGPAIAIAAAVALAAAAAGIGNSALAAAARGDARAARLAVRMQPWSAQPQRLRAELLVAGGRREDGRHLLEQALRLDPGDAASWYDLVLTGTPAERVAAVRHLARLDPLAVQAENRP
jgi:O-antigen ligase